MSDDDESTIFRDLRDALAHLNDCLAEISEKIEQLEAKNGGEGTDERRD